MNRRFWVVGGHHPPIPLPCLALRHHHSEAYSQGPASNWSWEAELLHGHRTGRTTKHMVALLYRGIRTLFTPSNGGDTRWDGQLT